MTSNGNDDLVAALKTVINSMCAEYDEATQAALRAALGSLLTRPSGTSLPELTTAAQGVLTFENRERAEQIAKTLSFGATNLANKRGWQKSGVVKTVKWLTADEPDVCGLCAALHRKVVGVKDCFLKRDDKLIGRMAPK